MPCKVSPPLNRPATTPADRPRTRTVARKLDFDDPQVLLGVRIAYVSVHALILVAYYYVSYKVRDGCDRGQGPCSRGLVDQAEERPDGAQVWCVQSAPLSHQTLTPVSHSRARKSHGTRAHARPVSPSDMLSTTQSGESEGKLVTTTVREYDLTETSKLIRSVYMGVAMMAFMHIYMKCVFLLHSLRLRACLTRPDNAQIHAAPVRTGAHGPEERV